MSSTVSPAVSLERRSLHYRRPLAPQELLPAFGVGIAAALAAFYVTRLLLERTPLLPELPIDAAASRSRLLGRP
jgi:hypothetical protein